jgi:hypothetical protein
MALSIKNIGSNMTELHFSGGIVLFSYNTPVAFYDTQGNKYVTDKKWSVTTSKHINKWSANYPSLAIKKEQEFFDNLVKGFEV